MKMLFRVQVLQGELGSAYKNYQRDYIRIGIGNHSPTLPRIAISSA